MPPKALDLIRAYDAASLQQMARGRGVEVRQKGKERLVAALAPVLTQPASVARALADLEPRERTVLDRLILAGGEAPTALLRRQLEREGVVERPKPPDRTNPYYYYQRPERGSPKNRDSRKFEDLVSRLGSLCLVFTAEPIRSTGSVVELNEPGRRLLVPADLLPLLPPVDLPVAPAPEPPSVRAADPAPALRDLYLLLSSAAREPIPVTARGTIPKRNLVRLAGGLSRAEDAAVVRSEDELAWLPFLRALAEERGLLVASVGELLLGPRAEDFLRRPAGERRTLLFEAYRQTGRWNELFRVPDLDVRGKGASQRVAAPAVTAARGRVLRELADLPVGAWVGLDHLTERLRVRAYEFLLPRSLSQTSYYYYSSMYNPDFVPNPYRGDNALGLTFDAVGDEGPGWDRVEAGFVRAVVAEALPALGAVDLGEKGGRPVAVRVTPDGARLLRGEPLASDSAPPHVVVQPNFQVFAFEPTGEDVLFALDGLADRVRAEQAVEYELTRDSVYRAQRAGMETAQIVAFLESVSTVGLPQNVRRTVEEWGGQHERITLRRRTPLLHARDEATLDALYADAALAPLLGRRVAPTVALVPHADLGPVADRLLAAGRLPALTEGPEERPEPAVDLAADGRLAFRRPVPSVYALHALGSFADGEDGGARLTQASLRRAARAGLSPDAILAALGRFSAGPLPPEVPALVRRWAKDWGRGALLETVLLQVEDATTFADLLADPELRHHLRPVPDAPTLALVRPEAAERVRAALEARGMALDGRLLG